MNTEIIQHTTLNTQPIKVAVVEDHQIVIDGLEKIITESDIACIIGKACNAAGCWKMLSAIQPDVLLLDIGLPDANGMDLCPQIKAKYPEIKILMLTCYTEYAVISHILKNGASGYILKSAMSDEIIEGICAVASGKQFLCEEVNRLLKKEYANRIELTRREHELLQLIIVGNSNSEIADKMCLGYETIKSYRKNLFQKMCVHNTTQLIKASIDMKLA